MNFSSYLNGESVRNMDVVNWVTVGAFDVPTSESAPVVAAPGRSLAFWLQPYNYFDRVRQTCSATLIPSLGPIHGPIIRGTASEENVAVCVVTCKTCMQRPSSKTFIPESQATWPEACFKRSHGHLAEQLLVLHEQGAASDLYGITVMSPTNYTRRAQPKYETYGVATEFSCVPSKNAAPFNRTEFSAYL